MAKNARPSKKPTTAERQQGKSQLAAILGDHKSPAAAAWKRQADALEKSLLAGDKALLTALTEANQLALVCWAAGNNRVELLRQLLAAGTDPNAALTINLPAFNFYLERDRTPVEMLAIDAGIESGEKGSIALRPLGPAVRNHHIEACRVLLEAGADPNLNAGSGEPMLDAVGHGYADLVRLLLSHGARTNIRSGNRTLLHMAASYKHVDVVRVLLDAGIDPNVPDGSGDPPLEDAARSGDVEVVRLLLAGGANVDPPTPTAEMITNPLLKLLHSRGQRNTSTPLIAAAELGHVEVVRQLLNAGANVSRTNNFGQTAYDIARKNNHVEVVALLRQAGAAGPGSIRPVDLFLAAAAGDVAGIDAALDSGIPVDAIGGTAVKDMGIERALRERPGIGPQDVMALLMLIGGSGGDPALVRATESTKREASQVPPEYHGMTALMVASERGHADAVATLLQRGALVDVRSTSTFNSGQTALYFAARAGHVQVMKLLLDAGANPSAQGASAMDEPTETPLHAAAKKGDVEAIRLLLERGARTDAENIGETPLMAAERKGHAQAAQMLRQAAAANANP